ncbi:MAG: hypothetical protein LBT16_12335, partial [Treponema sp.]|nr:hypothetical protein [Treponema sp.]
MKAKEEQTAGVSKTTEPLKSEAAVMVSNMPLLDHLEKIVALSLKKGFSANFFERAKPHLEVAASMLQLTNTQAALFAHLMNLCDNESIEMSDIAGSIKCNNIQLVKYMDDFEELERKYFIRCRRQVNEYKKRKEIPTYRVPVEVIEAVRKGTRFIPPDYKNLSIKKFFTVLGNLFEQRIEGELALESFVNEVHDLTNNNMQLDFCKKLKWYQFDMAEVILLLCFCDLYVNNDDDMISMHDLEGIYPKDISEVHYDLDMDLDMIKMVNCGLIENVNNDGFGDSEFFHLSEKAKNELLVELNLKNKIKRANLIKSSGIATK